jgi:hypothetical protein
VDEVLNDVDVQYHWSSIAGDIDEKASQMLLKEIVRLWLTIHGFSEAGAFVENYKKTNDKAMKRSVGTRKDLKRRKLDRETDTIKNSD